MSRLIRLYTGVLQKHPWKTQAATTGVLMATGDALAQLLVERKPISEYDVQRSSRFLIFGCVLSGPSLRLWYLVLEKIVRVKSAIFAPTIKVALDQAFMSPTFLTVFLGSMTYWRTKDVDEVKAKLRQDFKPILLNNYKLWPLAQLINFYFVPFQHRILYVNVIAVFWNTYLAYKSEQGVIVEEEEKTIEQHAA